ncbi:hypothetical protein AAY473_024731 [Plecturocebus cupreus]
MAAVSPLRTERVSVLSQPNSGVEDPTPAGGRGQGRRRGREELESIGAGSGASVPILPALRPGLGGVWGAGAASLVFQAGPGGSRLGWRDLDLVLYCSWACRSEGTANVAFPGTASLDFSCARQTWDLRKPALKIPGRTRPLSGRQKPAIPRGPLHRGARGDWGLRSPPGKGVGATGGVARVPRQGKDTGFFPPLGGIRGERVQVASNTRIWEEPGSTLN